MGKPEAFAQKPGAKLAAKSGAWQVNLRILATTDMHLHLLPYDYFTDQPSDTRGLARTATLIQQARAEVHNSILLDNGDFMNGTPMGDDILRRAMQSGQPHLSEIHPMIAAMNALHYDAATLGNHDFDHGADFLRDVLRDAAFPHVLANLHLEKEGDAPVTQTALSFTQPHVILKRTLVDEQGVTHPVRIGVIGFLPPNSLRPRGPGIGPLVVPDIVETARREVPRMRAEGVDVIIALAHSGIGEQPHTTGMENAIVPLSNVPGIDVIVGGHGHQVFPGDMVDSTPNINAQKGTINGVPVVIPGFWGSHLGLVDVTLSGDDTARDPAPVQVRCTRVEARPIYDRDNAGAVNAKVSSAPEIAQLVTPQHDRTLHVVRQPVGETTRPLHSYFSVLTPSPAVQLVQLAQRDFVSAAIQGGAYADLPVLSSTSAFKCGGLSGPDHYTNISVGEISMRGLADLYLYPNDLVAFRITGRRLRSWLERAASVFQQILPGQDEHLLIDQVTPCYLFETVFGVNYRIDLGQPALFTPRGLPVPPAHTPSPGRIRDLCHDGSPVQDTDAFILATNGFRASGGGRYPDVHDSVPVIRSGDCIRDILHDHVQARSVIDLDPQRHWHLSGPRGVTALFDCAPSAASALPDLPNLDIAPLDILPSGFRRYRLTF